ncbi:MAG TPA: hypothetical protein VFS63_01915 [Pseudolabrys sp.]|jgi:hypothetical protein|nr:hypothetical protein [Pseudolabrys sp.]
MDTRPEGTFGAQAKSDSPADVQNAAHEAAGAIKEKARATAEDVKAAGADQIAGVTRAVHGAADQLGQELPKAAGFIHAAAEKLEGASAGLRDKSVEEIVDSFGNFARRQPAVAFASAVLAGFALSRFLKSSAPDVRR